MYGRQCTLETTASADLLGIELLPEWTALVCRLRGGMELAPLDLERAAKEARVRYGLSGRLGGRARGDGYSINLGWRHHERVVVARCLDDSLRALTFGHELGHVFHYRDLLLLPSFNADVCATFRGRASNGWSGSDLWGQWAAERFAGQPAIIALVSHAGDLWREWVAERFAYELLAPLALVAASFASPVELAAQLGIAEGVVRVQLARAGRHAPAFECAGEQWCAGCGNGYAVPVGCACGRSRVLVAT